MLKWPNDKKSAAEVYELNERMDSGYYPVGISNMWHSGIHIPSYEINPIYPLLDGTLVAYRINKDYKIFDKPSIITEKKYKSLLDKNPYDKQEKEHEWQSTTYKLKEECKKEKDLYSNNFVLMSHELLVNVTTKEKIKFYTLYMNLAPDKNMNLTPDSTEKDHYKDYVDIDNSSFKIPFYREWVFKVKKGIIQEYKYVNGATLGDKSDELNPGDEFTMCNGDGDFFLSDDSKDVVVIKKYPKGTTKTVVKMSDIKGKLLLKSVLKDKIESKYGNIIIVNDNDRKLTTEQCIGFPAKLPNDNKYLYDLVLILEKELLGIGENLEFTFLNNKLHDTTGGNPIEPTDDLLTAVESGIISNIIEKKDSDDSEYVRLYDTAPDTNYYKRKKTLVFGWVNFFQKVTDVSNKNGDIFCDNQKLIKKIDALGKVDDQYQHDGIISKDEMHIIFNTGEFYNTSSAIRSKLRRLICQHPLEWNKNLYGEDFIDKGIEYGIPIHKTQQVRIKEVATATDIWEELGVVLRGKGITIVNNCLWFAHPIYFINHFKREGLLDFNPYEGKVLKARFPEKDDYEKIEVKSCPGFAPVYKKDTYKLDAANKDLLSAGELAERFPFSDLEDATNPNYCWAALNYPFGTSLAYDGYHYGIDFAGINNYDDLPIISMITGKVWATTWKGTPDLKSSLGRLMIIKDMNNDLLYMLGHLSSYKKDVDDYIYPGEIVANVGTTGGSSAEHLHLEVFVCTETNRDLVLISDKNKLYEDAATKLYKDEYDAWVKLGYPKDEEPSHPGLAWVGAFNRHLKWRNP